MNQLERDKLDLAFLAQVEVLLKLYLAGDITASYCIRAIKEACDIHETKIK